MISLAVAKLGIKSSWSYATILLLFLLQILCEICASDDLGLWNLFPGQSDLANSSDDLLNVESEIEEEDDEEDSALINYKSYALDPQSAVRLALAEQRIYTKLLIISVLFETRDDIADGACYQHLKNYLQDYEHDVNCLGGATGYKRAKQISEHPFLLFRLIRRLSGMLKLEIKESCNKGTETHNEIQSTIEKTLYRSYATLPENLDLDEALSGLIRIQFVYGLNASELRLGILQGVPTNVSLTVEDCTILALYAANKRAIIISYQWLDAAQQTLNEGRTFENQTLALRKLEESWKIFSRISGFKTKDEADQHLLGKREEDLSSLGFFEYEKYATCRGESFVSESERKKLKCYNGDEFIHAYWTIQPVKLEQLLIDPPLWKFHDFIRNKTIKYIKSQAHLNYQRSGVVGVKGGSSHRTSMQYWIYDDEESNPGPVMINLGKRIEKLLNFKVLKTGSSQATQVVEYSTLGGHYDFHQDSLSDTDHLDKDGDRIATFFMFLNDVELGGYTAFPEMKMFVKPEKGSAIIWRNVYFNGNPDERSLHAGCPVIKGFKLAANKWIMQNENMFEFQCSLDPNE